MIRTETLINLAIRRTGTPLLHLQPLVEGEPVAEPLPFSLAQWRELLIPIDACRRHLKVPGPPHLAEAAVNGAGLELFHHFLAPFWSLIEARCDPHLPRLLAIAADSPEVLDLPWELVQPPHGPPLALDPRWRLRRLPGLGSGPLRCCPFLPPPPLRVLVAVAAPRDQPPLDVEEELQPLRQAALGADAVFHLLPHPTLETLLRTVERFQPHIVYLAGHGYINQGYGFFNLADPDGVSDPRTGQELGQEVFAHSTVQGVIIALRGEGEAPPIAAAGAMARGLAVTGLPMVLAWPAPAPGLTRDFWPPFFQGLLHGEAMDAAIRLGRLAMAPPAGESGRPLWAAPMLYGATTQGLLFNTSPTAPRVMPERFYLDKGLTAAET